MGINSVRPESGRDTPLVGGRQGSGCPYIHHNSKGEISVINVRCQVGDRPGREVCRGKKCTVGLVGRDVGHHGGREGKYM